MTQISIINGIYSTDIPDFRTSYPRNLMPVPVPQGISGGYLRPAEGITEIETGPGTDRGGVVWTDGLMYRVMGSKFVSVDSVGTISTIDDVGDDGNYVTMHISFDYVSVTSNGNMFLYNGAALTQITDGDLGTSLDHVWVDGYFMSTDGEFVVVTELADPFDVQALKYASSSVSPDPIVALLKVNNEVYVINKETIEIFENVGGTGFPFAPIAGAQVQHGAIGTKACCVFMDTVVFVGLQPREGATVWQAQKGQAVKIATREIEDILSEYTEAQLSAILVESRLYKRHEFVYIHLPDKTLVYDQAASQIIGQRVWFILSSSTSESIYRARNILFFSDAWWCGDTESANLGQLTDESGEQWDNTIGWEFTTSIIFNESNSAIIHELELLALSHTDTKATSSTISTQYSHDGGTFSTAQTIDSGSPNGRNKNLTWLSQGNIGNWRVQKFSGTSDARLSFPRLEARIEPLTV